MIPQKAKYKIYEFHISSITKEGYPTVPYLTKYEGVIVLGSHTSQICPNRRPATIHIAHFAKDFDSFIRGTFHCRHI